MSFIELTTNQGKAEAVRHSLLQALQADDPTKLLGSIDSDQSLNPQEISRFLSLAEEKMESDLVVDSVWASRVALLGRDLQRSTTRHYVGRLIATCLSFGVNELPYDSQAGFKLFANSPTLRTVLSIPFNTRWLFDVEVLQRWEELTGRPTKVWEEPLHYWHDVMGSHISLSQYPRIFRELVWVTLMGPRRSKKAL